MRIITRVFRFLDRSLTFAVDMIIIAIILFAATSLWEVWSLYDNADYDESVLQYEPHKDDYTANDESISVSDNLLELVKAYPDVRCWIQIDDTNISYPVVQGSNNMEYIDKSFNGQMSSSGAVFLDYRNSGEIDDAYNLVYGHAMQYDKMFGDLLLYNTEDFFNSHKTGTLYLPEMYYDIQIFAVCIVDGYDDTYFNPTIYDNVDDVLKNISKGSIFIDDELDNEYKVIGLSTCLTDSTNGRIIVYGYLIPQGRDTTMLINGRETVIKYGTYLYTQPCYIDKRDTKEVVMAPSFNSPQSNVDDFVSACKADIENKMIADTTYNRSQNKIDGLVYMLSSGANNLTQFSIDPIILK